MPTDGSPVTDTSKTTWPPSTRATTLEISGGAARAGVNVWPVASSVYSVVLAL